MDTSQQQQPLSNMSVSEAERLVESLKIFPIDAVGTSDWKLQRKNIELLNFCSHTNATQKKDDFVMSALVTHEKIVVILHELLVMEAWRSNVLLGGYAAGDAPSIHRDVQKALIDSPCGIYMYVNYEYILVNFLECVLFHQEAVEGLGEDVLELLDYAWRQVSMLLAEGAARINTMSAADEKNESPRDTSSLSAEIAANSSADTREENFAQQCWSFQTNRAMASISILWFIVDRISLPTTPIAVVNAVLLKLDLLVGMSDVLLTQPWMRRSSCSKAVYKYNNGHFNNVNGDVQRVCAPEAHAWFIIHKLLCDRACRKSYFYTTYKKEAIMRVKRFLNDTLIDQIPALVDVQRALEEMSFLEAPSGTEEKFKNSLIIEPVARMHGSIYGGSGQAKDWVGMTETFMRAVKDPSARMEDATIISSVFDEMMNF